MQSLCALYTHLRYTDAVIKAQVKGGLLPQIPEGQKTWRPNDVIPADAFVVRYLDFQVSSQS